MRDTSQRFDPRQEMRRDDFEIFHNQDTRLDAVDLHHHDFYEVYLFLRGRVEWRIEGRLYRPQPGDLLLISPMELHQMTVDPQAGPYERIVLWIGRRYLEGFGGGELAADFIRADAVDRYIVGILPVIRGRGRRLFQEGLPPTELHLDRCTVADGIPILEYSRRGQ